MTGRRAVLALVAVGVFAAAAALQASCVSAFGVDDSSLRNAITDICACEALQNITGCEATLTARMNNASVAVQAAWLKRYVEDCEGCSDPFVCLSESPTCSVDKCAQNDGECCTVSGTGKAKCVNTHCIQPK